ncbi:MAG: toxin-antitoxin system YwqK family antitoxin [Rhodothermaceae bacterium]|nr:toxin-antitoxin system YwqK family antitoxin [Rhodothermaceae bacterium]
MRLTSLFILLTLLGVLLAIRILLTLNLLSGNSETTIVVADYSTEQIQSDSLTLVASEGRMYYEDTPFTGRAVNYFGNGHLAEVTEYVDGKREGGIERWYPSGQKSFKGQYIQNRRHGVVQTWWQNGTLRSESNYITGVPHGIQRQWYESGALFKELHLDNGQEAGLQRAWRENGKLYANYEAIDGRIYGLKRANLCYDLDGETIKLSIQ